MQAVIMHPDGVESTDDCETVVMPSHNLSSAERLAIYHNAYFARLGECMRGIYPLLARTIGDDAFDALAVGYLQASPSRSYTLDRLGDGFATFLDESRPDRDEQGRPTEDWPDFLMDLARLEWAIGQVFDGPGAEGKATLGAAQLLAVDPRRWPLLRLVPGECLRTMAFRFPVNEYFTALRALPDGADPPAFPARNSSWLALSRRDFVVRRRALSRHEYDLLTALMEGETIGGAIERLVAGGAADVDELADRLRDWFRAWTAAGYFVSLVE